MRALLPSKGSGISPDALQLLEVFSSYDVVMRQPLLQRVRVLSVLPFSDMGQDIFVGSRYLLLSNLL